MDNDLIHTHQQAEGHHIAQANQGSVAIIAGEGAQVTVPYKARTSATRNSPTLVGETLLIVGSRAEESTFPYGFFKDWVLDKNTGHFRG